MTGFRRRRSARHERPRAKRNVQPGPLAGILCRLHTLLFAFFVVLYSASKADSRKQMQVSASIDSAFRSLGIFPGEQDFEQSEWGGQEDRTRRKYQ